MKIVAVNVLPYRVPLRQSFITALRRVDVAEGVLVTVTDSDGRIGIGEAVPTVAITGETEASITTALAGPLRDAVIDRHIDDLDATLLSVSKAMVANTSAKAALDIALHDAWARSLGAPLHRLLGGTSIEPLVTHVTISLSDPHAMARDAATRVAEGFSRLKVKLGGPSSDDDFARLLAVREAVGPKVTIRVDANQGWSPKQAIALIRRFEEAGFELELVEQPVPARDVDGLSLVTASVSTTVMADESCFGTADALELLRRRAVDAINVKLMKCGGIRAATAILEIAKAAGVSCSIGSMLEGIVSVTAAASLAAAARTEVHSVDLDAPLWMREPILDGGALFEGERIVLGSGPGLAIDLPPVGSTHAPDLDRHRATRR